MKKIMFAFLVILTGCIGKGGKNHDAPLDDTDSPRIEKVDTVAADQLALRDTSAAYLARVRANQKPVIKTGADQVITGTTLTLNGSKSYDPDGSISKWLWIQEKGPLVNLINGTKSIATVNGLVAGEYRFRLTITDNRLATATDTIHVSKPGTVDTTPTTTPPPPPPVNKPPTVNAGPDKTITLPTNSVTLNAVATDPEGGPITYKWSVPGATSASVTLSYTEAGRYAYGITVTDNGGLTASDSIVVFVNPVASTGTRKNLTLESTFETGYAGWNIADQTCCSYSAALSSDFARAGGKSMRIELRRGDPLVSSSARAEIEPDAGGSSSATSEAWYGFSMYVPSDWVASTNPESPIQFHQEPNVSGTEPIGFWIDGNNFEMMITRGLNVGNTYVTGPAVKKGAWNDIVLHIKWDAGTNGIVQAWVNGSQFCDYKGVTNYPGQGYYAKVGVYKWYWQDASTKDNMTSRIYYFDEFRIGTALATYNDVAP